MIYPDSYEHKTGFDHIRQQVASGCKTQMGRSMVDDMAFMTDFMAVRRALDSTAEMVEIETSDDRLPLDELPDIGLRLREISVAGTFLTTEDLVVVRRLLNMETQLSDFFSSRRDTDNQSTPYPNLDAIAQGLMPFTPQLRAIDKAIDQYGNVKDNASPELNDIRRRLSSMSGRINAAMRRVMDRALNDGYIDSDTKPAIRDGRLVLPVAAMNKRRVHGIVHDESATGKTVYIEPAEVVEANNALRELQMEEHREIVRILTALTDYLRPSVNDMLSSLTTIGELDFIHAKAVFAITVGGQLPVLHAEPGIEWYHACHPALLLSLQKQGKEIVPLDITLNPQGRILIISGPNAGGKSVCLKTVAVIQYMTQCGLLPPVFENSHIGIFDNIFVDIGDDQSMEDDLSTYSSHLRNMKLFVQRGNNRTMVLIDEFGGGTEPQIGGAIAQAVLHQFNEHGMWGVITTHYQNLKHYADETDGIVNGSMLYDRHLMQPLFRLSIGNAGSSFAIEIARKTGLPEIIIKEAEQIVGSDYINMDRYLLDIARDRRYWENKRLSIRQKEKRIEERLAQYENDAEQLRQRRREIIDDAKSEARRILDSSNATIERAIHDIREAQAERKRTIEVRRQLDRSKSEILDGDGREHKLLKKAPKAKQKKTDSTTVPDTEPIRVGDNVRLDGEGTVGEVLEISNKDVIVAFGQLKTTVKMSRLKRTVAKAQFKTPSTSTGSGAMSDSQRQRQLNFSQEIDLRGFRVDEAVQALTYYIDDAIRFNAKRVRILHGTGTGALRQYLRQYLDTVPGVHGYHDEHVQFGGAGITVVDLE